MPMLTAFVILPLLGSVGITGFAATAINAVAAAALTAAAGYALSPDPPRPKPDRQQQNVFSTAEPRRRRYGRIRVGGAYGYYESADGRLWQVVLMNSGEIAAYESFWYNDEVVTLNGSGQITAPDRYIVAGSSRVRVTRYFGTDGQTADADLQAAFPSTWTTRHKLRQIAYVVSRASRVPAEKFNETFPQGAPQISAVLNASRCYDPRDPAQTPEPTSATVWSNPTWTFTENPVIQLLDHLRHPDGMRFALADFYLPNWIAAANKCDELVPTYPSGTRKRYIGMADYSFAERPAIGGQQIMSAFNGKIFLRPDGLIDVTGGWWEEPEVTLTDEDIISFSDLAAGSPSIDDATEWRIKITSPDHNWQEIEIPPYRTADYDASQRQTTEISFSSVADWRQARHLARQLAARARPAWSATFEIRIGAALRLVGQTRVRIHSTLLDLDLVAEINGSVAVDLENNRASMSWSAIDKAAFDPMTAEEEGSPPAPLPPRENDGLTPDAPTGLSLVAGQRVVSGTLSGAYLALTWTAAADDALVYEAEYSLDGSGEWTPLLVGAGEHRAESGIVADTLQYLARVRAKAPSGRVSAWAQAGPIAAIADPTPPAAPTSLVLTSLGTGVKAAWTNPNDPRLYAARVRRASGGSPPFSSSTVVATLYGAIGASREYSDLGLPAGTYTYWIETTNASNVPCTTPLGPSSITI